MAYQPLLFEIKGGIAFVTINRPDKLNALNDQVMLELGDAAERIATESEIKGAILTGAGPKSFVAGADIGDLSRQGPFDGQAPGPPRAGGPPAHRNPPPRPRPLPVPTGRGHTVIPTTA